MPLPNKELRDRAEYFAKALAIPFDKIVIKTNGQILFRQTSHEVGLGSPSVVISRGVVERFAAHDKALLTQAFAAVRPEPSIFVANLNGSMLASGFRMCAEDYDQNVKKYLEEMK
jgi:hypothetical protein